MPRDCATAKLTNQRNGKKHCASNNTHGNSYKRQRVDSSHTHYTPQLALPVQEVAISLEVGIRHDDKQI